MNLGIDSYYHHYQLVHQEKSDEVINGLQLVFIELPKFQPQTFSEIKMQVLWLRFTSSGMPSAPARRRITITSKSYCKPRQD